MTFPNDAVQAACVLMEADGDAGRGFTDRYSAKGYLRILEDVRRVIGPMDDAGKAQLAGWLIGEVPAWWTPRTDRKTP